MYDVSVVPTFVVFKEGEMVNYFSQFYSFTCHLLVFVPVSPLHNSVSALGHVPCLASGG